MSWHAVDAGGLDLATGRPPRPPGRPSPGTALAAAPVASWPVAVVAAHVASGARLWLLTGAVASALAAGDPDPFAPWARLVVGGWWPVGPSGGRLVVGAA